MREGYFERPVTRKVSARLSAAARRPQPPHGLTPNARVTFFTTSPKPMSRLRRGRGTDSGRSLLEAIESSA